jgi:arginyl-tRNA synthetase
VGFKEIIEMCFAGAVESAGFSCAEVKLVLEKPRLKEHGDIGTPIALSLARVFKKNPVEIAERIAASTEFPADTVASVDVAKPGYINLRLAEGVLLENLREIQKRKDAYGRSEIGRGEKCQVEYISANPTGPLVVVSARAAAVGSAIVNLLRAVGYRAESEYYVND